MNDFPAFTLRGRFLWAAGGLTMLGCLLRLRGAQGDLWLDEVWSVWLVGKVHSPGEIFWGINHANNHLLNSLWIYAAGQNAGAFTYRLPAVVFGTLTVPAAGWAVRRQGQAAMLIAMTMFATSFVLVEYGSQARGYSGLVLFALLAIDAAREAVGAQSPRPRRRAAWWMALWLCLGFLCHILMVQVLAAIALWALYVFYRRSRSVVRALGDTVAILWPGIFLMLPIAMALAAGAASFDLGNSIPFASELFLLAYGQSLLLMTGSFLDSPQVRLWAVPVFAAATVYSFAVDRQRDAFYLAALIAVPLLFYAACLPNTANPRYFLLFGVMFLLGICEFAGKAVRLPRYQMGVLTILLFLVAVNVTLVGEFFRYGRGNYSSLFRKMDESGTIRYGTTFSVPVHALMDYYGGGLGATAVEIPFDEWCTANPHWLILTNPPGSTAERLAGEVRTKCGYRLDAVPFTTFGLSSPIWRIYHVKQS